jgi:hypothetical protein
VITGASPGAFPIGKAAPDPSRLVCGVATCFGVRSHDGRIWQREEFDAWLRLEEAVPLRVDHAPLAIESNGTFVNDVGAARRFCPVTAPVEGLLTLCEISPGPWGDALLEDLLLHQQRWHLPQYGMSLGALHIRGEAAMPYEVSLTTRPGFPDAKVISVGERAMKTFEFLSGDRDGQTLGKVFGRA